MLEASCACGACARSRNAERLTLALGLLESNVDRLDLLGTGPLAPGLRPDLLR